MEGDNLILARWQIPEDEKRDLIDFLQPSPPRVPQIGGISMNIVALASALLGAVLLLVSELGDSVSTIGAIGVMFAAVWFPLRLVARAAAVRQRERMERAHSLLEIRYNGYSIFGESFDWTLDHSLDSRSLEEVTLRQEEGHLQFSFTCSYITSRGSDQGKRVQAVELVPVPKGREEEAAVLTDQLNQSARRAKE